MLLQSPLLLQHNFPLHGFTTRLGGVSQGPFRSWNLGGAVGDDPRAVAENTRLLGAALQIDGRRFRGVTQVHQRRVLVLEEPSLATEEEEADALLSRVPGPVVGVRTADCVPLLLADRSTRHVAAVHAGWRGVVRGVLGETLRQLTRHSSLASLLVVMGPHICRRCFQVGPDVAAQFPQHATPDPKAPHKFLVDLQGALLEQLQNVPPEQIHCLDRCTCCEPETFFSYRQSQGICGRQFNFIGA